MVVRAKLFVVIIVDSDMDDSGGDGGDGGSIDNNGEVDADCGDGQNKVDCGINSDGDGGGDSTDDGGTNDNDGADTDCSYDPHCADGKSKFVCCEGTAGDDGSDGDPGPNDDGSVYTNESNGGGDGDINVANNMDGADGD